MKPLKYRNWSGRIQSLTPSAGIVATFSILCLLAPGLGRAAGTVTTCTEASLRAAMAGYGIVTFACDGTITLANTLSNVARPPSMKRNLILDGSGHQITISGNHVVGVFYVGTNMSLGLVNLTVTNGFSTKGGGGICNQFGMVCATNCIFTGNWALPGYDPPGYLPYHGGAILNQGGYLNLQNCLFTNNVAGVGLGGYSGFGGAIFNTGSLNADNCQFVQNLAAGSPGISYGGSSGGGGWALGGAIYNSGDLVLCRSSFVGNSTTAGDGSNANGGHSGVRGGSGGGAYGGAICNDGTLLLQNSTVAANSVTAGNGGSGSGSTGPPLPSGAGGDGGSAYGAIYNTSTANLVNVSVALNNAVGGAGGAGGIGSTIGTAGSGGPAVGGMSGCSLTSCTVASNCATAGSGSGGISAGGIVGGVLANTLLAGNSPANCSGTITDAGHNFSSDASCVLPGSGSMTNTDPKLGPLADNGGSTLTMALLPGSPAIDAGSVVAAPVTDQRGVPRPQGHGVDIGAFEYLVSPIFTGMTVPGATNCLMQLSGLTPNPALTLQVSTNLLFWWDATNFMACSNGVFQCIDPITDHAQSRFYRLKSGTP